MRIICLRAASMSLIASSRRRKCWQPFMKSCRRIGNMCKISNNITAYNSTKHLLKRLNEDMLTCHRQMEVLKIVFKNLEGSWLAISLSHKVVKDEAEEG